MAAYLLVGHIFGQADDEAVAADGRPQGKTETSVAAGGLNDGVARLDATAPLGLREHAERNAVLSVLLCSEEKGGGGGGGGGGVLMGGEVL